MNPPPRRGLRRAAIALVVSISALLALLLVLLLALWFGLPRWFDAERVSALLLERAGTASGLDWSIAGEPQLHWRPRPRLILLGLHAQLPDGSSVLRVERLELVLPWASLREGVPRITTLRIEGARVDGEAFARWWDARPRAAPGSLPTIEQLTLIDGEWQQDGLRLHGLGLELEDFGPGQRLRLRAEGRIETGGAAATALPPPGPGFRLVLAGDLQFAPLWQADLKGELSGWPEGWPPLPAPLDPAQPIRLTVTQSGLQALDAPLQLQLETTGARAQLHFVPRALLAWQAATERSQLPPLRLQAQGEVLEIDGVRLEGLRLDIEPDHNAAEYGPAPP